MKQSTFSAVMANSIKNLLQGYSKTIRLLLVMFVALTVSAEVWGADVTVIWPKTTALSTTATNVDGDANVTIKVSEANAYTSPLRFYAGKTTTIEVAEGYQLKSVAYEASSTGNYVTYAQNATVSPDVTPSVNSKIITWDLSGSNTKTFTFTPSSQTRCNGITITYTYTAGGGDPADPYTVTLVPGSGSVTDTELEEPNAGEGVTLPTPTLNGCDEWSFAGWKTTSAVTTETTTEPTLIPAGAYSPTSDITLYAVYQRTEDGGGGSTTGSKTLVSNSSSSYYESGYITGVSGTNSASWTADGFTMVQNKNSSSNAVALNYAEIRVYASHSIVFTPSTGSTITSIVATATTDAYANALGGSSITNCTKSVSSSTVTITPTDGTKAITITNTAQSRLKTIVVNYTTSGSGSTTYYHSTPDCATQTAVYLIPKNSDFWMAYLRRIFGASSARVLPCRSVAYHSIINRLPVASSSPPTPILIKRHTFMYGVVTRW